MDLWKISDRLFVAGQITESDLRALAAHGIRSVICNRPDGEEADQPTFAELSGTAKTLGLQMRYIPVSGGSVHDKDAAAFGAALNDLPGPILAYCRSGMRSATLWSVSQAEALPPADWKATREKVTVD